MSRDLQLAPFIDILDASKTSLRAAGMGGKRT